MIIINQQNIKILRYTAKSLKEGRTYEFRLSAFNQSGSSSYVMSEAVTVRSVMKAPYPPINLRYQATDDDSRMSMTWDEPEVMTSQGCSVVAYLIEQYDDVTMLWKRVGEKPPDVLSFTVNAVFFYVYILLFSLLN